MGHDDWIRRTPDRLYLECLECGRETQGWVTKNNPVDRAGGAFAGAQVLTQPRAHQISYSGSGDRCASWRQAFGTIAAAWRRFSVRTALAASGLPVRRADESGG